VSNLRVAIIGLGNMGGGHLDYLPKVPGVTVSAVCDNEPTKLEKGLQKLAAAGVTAQGFASYEEMLDAKVADAVVVATPHYDHPPMGIRAFETGHHVLVEKPIAVGVKGARELIAAAKKYPKQVFGIMFNQRSNPMYAKLRELVTTGELGDITRVTWLITDWFRTHTYYASGGWRATWAGEGGGVLINQNPHNLDLLQWLPGMMPSRVTAIASLGKTHPIEVEDEVSAILEYPNGATAHFVTGTGEFPGTDRLEIAGDRGRLVCERGTLKLFQTRKSVRHVRETSKEAFAQLDTWELDVPVPAPRPDAHKIVTQNFVNAILKNEPLIASGEEGIKGLEIGNAMLMAGVTRQAVDLPMNADAFDTLLKDLEKQYGGKKKLEAPKDAVVDMGASFAKN
jgi:predicted dehydrogenase